MTIDTAPKNTVFLHHGQPVFWSSDMYLIDVEPGVYLRSPKGDIGRVEDVLRDGRCVISWDEHETTERVNGWTVVP